MSVDRSIYRATEALTDYHQPNMPQDYHMALVDLLIDLQHLAEWDQLDFDECVELARASYEIETQRAET